MRSQPEQRLQRQIVGYLSWALAPPAWFSSFPAGGGGEMRGMILKGMGLKPGVPDLLLVHDGRAYWAELKAPKGVVSDAQKATHEALQRAKCPVAVVRSLDEFRALLAGPWWPLMACIRETKPSMERIRHSLRLALAAELDDCRQHAIEQCAAEEGAHRPYIARRGR